MQRLVACARRLATGLATLARQTRGGRDELRHPALTRLDVQDRLMRRIAAEERLVRDHEPRSSEHHAGRGVERDRGAVGSWPGNHREPLEVPPARPDHRDLVAAGQGCIDPARLRNPEPVGSVEWPTLPDSPKSTMPVMGADANGVELSARGTSVRAPC